MPTYRAFQVTGQRQFELVEREIVDPEPGRVRVRVLACGVCHSDFISGEGARPDPSRVQQQPGLALVELTCPRCHEGKLVAGNRGWGCSRWREGCTFVIWFLVAGRRLSDAELGDLVSKGKTRRRKWKAGDGAEINGRLVLDLSAPRDDGAARLETGAGK